MRIRLTRKFALCLNRVDISKLNVGDEVDLPDRSAILLLLEGWAEPIELTPRLARLHSLSEIDSTGARS
jgi:hypothetical protein